MNGAGRIAEATTCRFALPLALASLLTTPILSQQPGNPTRAIRGTVTDTAGVPLSYCYVRLGGARGSILCDQDGRFRLGEAASGSNTFEVRRLGYIPAEFTVSVLDTVLDVTVQLSPIPVPLQPVTVTASGLMVSLVESGFYERMRLKTGTGTYIQPEEIAQLHPQHVTQLLSDRPSLKMGYTGTLAIPWDRNGDCILNTFVDGIEIKNLYGDRTGQRIGRHLPDSAFYRTIPRPPTLDGVGIDNFISPDAIAAIEIYPSGPGVPARFQVFGSCGAIVIWTKRGAPAPRDSSL